MSHQNDKHLAANISAVQSKLGLLRNNTVRYDLNGTALQHINDTLHHLERLTDQLLRISVPKAIKHDRHKRNQEFLKHNSNHIGIRATQAEGRQDEE